MHSWSIFDGFVSPPPPASWHSIATWADLACRDLAEVSAAFESERSAWRARLADLGGDPCAIDWGGFRPLRLSREEDWSDWLAFLLEASKTGEFARRLLGGDLAPEGTDFLPRLAEREVASLDGARRADIRVEWKDGRCTCIEVTVGDLHLEKTDATAHGIDATWSAVLLPKDDLHAWSGSRPSDSPTVPITWHDVARALRRALWLQAEPLTWLAWAYAYLAKVEQDLLRLPAAADGGLPTLGDLLARSTRLRLMQEARIDGR